MRELEKAVHRHQAGNLTEAKALYDLGLALQREGKFNEAVRYFRNTLHLAPNCPAAYKSLGISFFEQGNALDAERCFHEAIGIKPDDPECHFNLGILFLRQGKFDKAIECFRTSLRFERHFPEALNNLGLAFQRTGNMKDAEECFRDAIRIRPDFPDALNNLGNILRMRGEFEEGARHVTRAIQIAPHFAGAFYNLGCVLLEKGDVENAVLNFRKSISLDDRLPEAHNNLAMALAKSDRLTAAERSFRRALQLSPGFAPALGNLGVVLMEQGRLKEALETFSRVLEIKPDFSAAHSSKLLCMIYQSAEDQSRIFRAHQEWARLHADRLTGVLQPHHNDPDPVRRLRIGYVSPDFRTHSVSFFIEPVIEAHNRLSFDIICYSDVARSDKMTERLREKAGTWRNIYRVPDKKVYDLIKEDRIDILVDLAGHTGDNRLLVFARKPAPVQVTYLGYPNTTGLSSIDYRITDEWADPIGKTDEYHTEELVRLPGGFLCYRPPDGAPEVGKPPVLETGKVTFGSFNNLSKITPEVAGVWSEILRATPDSCLIIKSRALANKGIRARLKALFLQYSVSSHRIRMIGQTPSFDEHLRLYNIIDIGLDPFPYNGTTTTCEALWMGVPVVVLAGTHHAARIGVSLLSRLGLHDLIANTRKEYVDKAVRLAGDLEVSSRLRADLRARLARSNITDAEGFTRSLEAAYRKMWRKWCGRFQANGPSVFHYSSPAPDNLSNSNGSAPPQRQGEFQNESGSPDRLDPL